MTWEIAIGIFALVSFSAVVIGWSSKISGTLSKLNVAVDSLNKTLDKFQTASDKVHDQLFSKANEADKRLADHEARIRTLERRAR